MTIATAVGSASLRVVGTVPAAVFSSTDQVIVEMRDLARDVAEDIARACDWRDLTKVAVFTGDGSTTAFAKPTDYDRMAQGEDIVDPPSWFWGYQPVMSVSEWLKRERYSWISPGGWILLGGQFQFYPAPSGTAEFPYISKNWALSAEGVAKPAFDQDTDTFALDEGLLTLGLIWRYRSQKGLDYSEDLANYNFSLSQLMTKDKGSRVIRKHERTSSFGARPAWPWELGGA